MTRLPGLLLGCCVLLGAPIGVGAFQARYGPAVAPAETGLITGVVEAVNGRTGVLEVRTPNGRLFLVEALGARFEAATSSGTRAAELVDVRPGSRVEVSRRASAARGRNILVVRITGLPIRTTPDPFGTTPAPVQSVVRGEMAVGGRVRSIDRAHGTLVVRSGPDDLTIRVSRNTRFEGFDIRNVDLSYLRVGDPITVVGSNEGDSILAEELTLNAPGGSIQMNPFGGESRGAAPAPSPARPPDRPAALTRPDTGAPLSVFSGTVVRANADRTRVWVKTPLGERALIVPASLYARGSGLERKQMKPGARLLVSARRQARGWTVSGVEVQ